MQAGRVEIRDGVIARTILSPTTGFIAEAGFTHSLTPARNCTFGCTYCYVPTMRIFGGLRPDDWKHWGEFTTFKSNAPELLARQLRKHQVIYCSPTVDPYQPAEGRYKLTRACLEVLCEAENPFAIITRGPMIVRDVDVLVEAARRADVSVTFSIPANAASDFALVSESFHEVASASAA